MYVLYNSEVCTDKGKQGDRINFFASWKKIYSSHCYSDKGLKGTVVNQAYN